MVLRLRYKEQFGSANTQTYYITPDGYELGYWQSRQRAKYKRKQLMPHEIERLEEIGFVWDLTFEKGVLSSLEYKEQFGNVNAPLNYKTHNGYNLGQWQNYQRIAYKNGSLANKNINRLEKIGFRWDVKGESLSVGEGEV